MGITRKFIFSVIALILIVSPLFSKINAEKPSVIFNGDRVLVVDNSFEFEIKAYGNTVDEVLKNANIPLHEKDIIFPKDIIFSNITNNIQKIIILRSKIIYLDIHGKREEIFTSKNKVGEVIEEKGIELTKNDLINYSLTDEIFPGMEIQIQKKPSLSLKPKSRPKPIDQITRTGEVQSGIASWYSYIPGNYCASLKFPRGSKLLVTNVANNRSVVVTVNDRGPFIPGRVIDLERSAFAKIASVSAGVASVRVERIQ